VLLIFLALSIFFVLFGRRSLLCGCVFWLSIRGFLGSMILMVIIRFVDIGALLSITALIYFHY
jgi:hypothetical protein